MANSVKNPRVSSKYPQRFNKRENRGSTHQHTLLVSDAAYTILTTDSIAFVRNTGAVSITLPDAGENVGRCIKFIQVDLDQLTIVQAADGANIDGADASFTGCDAADDQVELYCDGSEWLVTAQNIA